MHIFGCSVPAGSSFSPQVAKRPTIMAISPERVRAYGPLPSYPDKIQKTAIYQHFENLLKEDPVCSLYRLNIRA